MGQPVREYLQFFDGERLRAVRRNFAFRQQTAVSFKEGFRHGCA
jgi:hypothetical protein